MTAEFLSGIVNIRKRYEAMAEYLVVILQVAIGALYRHCKYAGAIALMEAWRNPFCFAMDCQWFSTMVAISEPMVFAADIVGR